MIAVSAKQVGTLWRMICGWQKIPLDEAGQCLEELASVASAVSKSVSDSQLVRHVRFVADGFPTKLLRRTIGPVPTTLAR